MAKTRISWVAILLMSVPTTRVGSQEVLTQIGGNPPVLAIAVDSSDNTYASIAYDNKMRIHSMKTGLVLKEQPVSDVAACGVPLSLVYSSDGKYLLACSSQGKWAARWDVKNGNRFDVPIDLSWDRFALALDSEFLFSFSTKGTYCRRSMMTGKSDLIKASSSGIAERGFGILTAKSIFLVLEDDSHFMTGCVVDAISVNTMESKGQIKIPYSRDDSQAMLGALGRGFFPRSEFPELEARKMDINAVFTDQTGSVGGLCFFEKSNELAVTTLRNIYLVDVDRKLVVRKIPSIKNDFFRSIVNLNDRKTALAWTWSDKCIFVDFEANEFIEINNQGLGKARCWAWTADHERLVTGGSDGAIRAFSNKQIRELRM
jgi:WD40 repeat protein